MVGQQRVIGGEDAVDAVTQFVGQRGDITSFASVVYVDPGVMPGRTL